MCSANENICIRSVARDVAVAVMKMVSSLVHFQQGARTNAAGCTSTWLKGGLLKRERRVAAVLFSHIGDSVFCL